MHVSISTWEKNILMLGKYEMFEYNLKAFIYIYVLCIYLWLLGNMSYIESICLCKSMRNRRRLHTRKGKTSMVSTLVVSSKGMYLRVWMLFTSVFTCICFRMYIHKINVTCHKHAWWVSEVYINSSF